MKGSGLVKKIFHRLAPGMPGSLLAILLLVLGPVGWGQAIDGCALFPPNNIWNVPVDRLAVDPNSAAYVETIGKDLGMHPDFGSGTWEGGPIGIPYVSVPGTQPRKTVTFEYADESDPGPYPIPDDPPIEGGPASDGDRHVLVLDRDNCILYELFYAFPRPDGSWQAGSGAVFDLKSHRLRPDGWTSADAAGLPILPGLVRYEEVAAGEIRHAMVFTFGKNRDVSGGQIMMLPPACRSDGWYDNDDPPGAIYPIEGMRFQLDPSLTEADFDDWGLTPEGKVLARALQEYGMFLGDNGGSMALTVQLLGPTKKEHLAAWEKIAPGFYESAKKIPANQFRVIYTGEPTIR